jgi:WhiB family redox-sensing transcriptional regulator
MGRSRVAEWAHRGNCAAYPAEHMHVQGAAQNEVKRICRGCPVVVDCLVEALDNDIEWGVWGGLTERERRRLKRRCPKVTNWRKVVDPAA